MTEQNFRGLVGDVGAALVDGKSAGLLSEERNESSMHLDSEDVSGGGSQDRYELFLVTKIILTFGPQY